MAPRLPTLADFPPSLELAITPPPSSQQTVNVLILLHGLGDSIISFNKLAKQLNLPETTCVSIQAPAPLPFDLGGFHWGDDINFDSGNGQMDFDAGFENATRIIGRDSISKVLVEKCSYPPRNIILFGLGQGGMAAFATAQSISEELGGVVSIGGPLPISLRPREKNKTPVLVLGGSSNTMITQSAVNRIKTAFANVEYHKWAKSGDGMPSNREEMLPIMKFFARRLKSRSGVPEGSVEIG